MYNVAPFFKWTTSKWCQPTMGIAYFPVIFYHLITHSILKSTFARLFLLVLGPGSNIWSLQPLCFRTSFQPLILTLWVMEQYLSNSCISLSITSPLILLVLRVKLSSCQSIVLLNYNKETKLIDFRHYSIRL